MQISQAEFFLFNGKSQNALIQEFGHIAKKAIFDNCNIILAICESFYVLGIQFKNDLNGYRFIPVKNLLYWQMFFDKMNRNLLN